jgi:hypothetical protein
MTLGCQKAKRLHAGSLLSFENENNPFSPINMTTRKLSHWVDLHSQQKYK